MTVASYDGNKGTDAGNYVASVTFAYDDVRYEKPVLEDLAWVINKATYDMSGAGWDYTGPFTFDGMEKTVSVTGLPEGVAVVSYEGSTGTNAGGYAANVTLASKSANYETPVLAGLNWAIDKATYDMSGAGWDYVKPFPCDGTDKTVKVTGLPSGVKVASYTGNVAKEYGIYTAKVTLHFDALNYNAPTMPNLTWYIGMATYDMSAVRWEYSGPFTYDNTEKTVRLTGLPSGVTVASYTGNTATNAGYYTAKATLLYDKVNYLEPKAGVLNWSIQKAKFDMGGAKWDYIGPFTYDGTPKTVLVTGLPDGVTASYSHNTKSAAGYYTASAALEYDKANYDEPRMQVLNWVIKKAKFDMAGAKWDYAGPFTYDGTPKTVLVTGLPQGVKAGTYSGNTAINAGDYNAYVTLQFDSANYEEPRLNPLSWSIKKARFDLSGTKWDYAGPFTYDGTRKTVVLTGLPQGVRVVSYGENSAINAGNYSATVALAYDWNNYENIQIPNLSWTIKRAQYDMSGAKWDYTGPFTYDGTPKTVLLTGLPQGITIMGYDYSTATNAGNYTAVAALAYDDRNYEKPTAPSLKWSILKAKYDMSGAKWDYTGPFTYDARVKTVRVTGLPKGVTVNTYFNTIGLEAGTYKSSVTLSYDSENFEQPAPLGGLEWVILKAQYDMSGAKWDYTGPFTYDGRQKVVLVTGLPNGVVVGTYQNNYGHEVGQYTARATFSFDRQNFTEPSIADLAWAIKPSSFGGQTAILTADPAGASAIRVTWSGVATAQGYELWRADSENGTYVRVFGGADTAFTNNGCKAGTVYWYKARAYTAGSSKTSIAYGPFSAARPGVALSTPQITGTAGNSATSVKVTWAAAAGADGYELWSSNAQNGLYKKVATLRAATGIDTGLKAGAVRWYKVRAYKAASGSITIYTELGTAVQGTALAKAAKPSAVVKGPTSVKLSWKAVAGATGYELWMAPPSGEFTRVYRGSALTFTNTGLKAGTAYRYQVRAYHGDCFGAFSDIITVRPK
ncbi:MAG TPA: fibronectin type III domain-containing protein [Candidatus Limnocylindria bacterium]|nr:fibronectin type III domain-containing protein [Candidatus Limnocylindria bacterium]